MTVASKKEAQAALNKARTKAQNASVALYEAENAETDANGPDHAARVNRDAARAFYDRCVRELEEALNDYAPWDLED